MTIQLDSSISPTACRRARIAVAVTFAVHAAAFGTWAARIPSIKNGLGLDYRDLAIALAILAAGQLVGTRLTGRIERRASTAQPLRFAVPMYCLALAAVAGAPNLPSLCVVLFVLGTFVGFIDVTMNVHGVAVQSAYGRPIMCGFHGLWSVGIMASAGIAALAARWDVDVTVHFPVMATLLAGVSVLALRWLLPPDLEVSARPEPDSSAGARAPALIVIALFVAAFGGVLAEYAMTDWSAVLLHVERNLSESGAALGPAVFGAATALARFCGDWLRARIGSGRLAGLGAAVACAGLLITIAAPSPLLALVGLAVVGLGIGPIAPVVYSTAGELTSRRGASVLSIAVSASYLGVIVGPMLIGAVATHVGLSLALLVPLLFLAPIVPSYRLIGRSASRPHSVVRR